VAVKVTEFPAQILVPDPEVMATEGVTPGLTVKGMKLADPVADVLLRQLPLLVAVTATDCNCATVEAVVVKLLFVAPGTGEPFIDHCQLLMGWLELALNVAPAPWQKFIAVGLADTVKVCGLVTEAVSALEVAVPLVVEVASQVNTSPLATGL